MSVAAQSTSSGFVFYRFTPERSFQVVSLDAITWAYRTEVGSPTRKAVLLVLANYADEDDSAYPSANRIAKMTELSNSTVRKALDELQEMGVIADRVPTVVRADEHYALSLCTYTCAAVPVLDRYLNTIRVPRFEATAVNGKEQG